MIHKEIYFIESLSNLSNPHAIRTPFSKRALLQLEYKSLKSPLISKDLPQDSVVDPLVLKIDSAMPLTEGKGLENLS